jgi:hypothetical protein
VFRGIIFIWSKNNPPTGEGYLDPQHYFSEVEMVRDLEEALLKAS